MEITIGVILLATAILNIILFFKIWIMTNDTEKIREFLEIIVSIKEHDYKNKTTKNNKDIDKNDIELYSWVIEIKSRKEFQVIEILDKNTYLCVNEKNQNGVKFKRFEIEKS
jgi:hypothetical protein